MGTMHPGLMLFFAMSIFVTLLIVIHLCFLFLSKRNCLVSGKPDIMYKATCGGRIGMLSMTFPFGQIAAGEEALELQIGKLRKIRYSQVKTFTLRSWLGIKYMELSCRINGKSKNIVINGCNCVQLASILNEKTQGSWKRKGRVFHA